jgi:predicted small lipoprotein YifL
MKRLIQAVATLAASIALAACGGNAPATNNSAAAAAPSKPAPAAPANEAAPAAGNAVTIGSSGRRPTLTVINRSQTPIVNFYIGPTSSDDWGDDLFTAGDPLAAGASTDIVFDRNEDVCVWDVKVTVQGGADHELRNINLCTTHEVVYEE